jgi:peptidoglycan hydrolase CwlO-like protein
MTQQNAALVEESAAAAESLREQAARLAELVAAFRTVDALGRHQIAARQASSHAAAVTQVALQRASGGARKTTAVRTPTPRPPEAAPQRSSDSPKTSPGKSSSPPSDGDWTSF